MMKKKGIKAANLFCIWGCLKLLLLLCFFIFNKSLYAQIYISEDTKIVVKGSLLYTQDSIYTNSPKSLIHQPKIYVKKGTIITGKIHADIIRTDNILPKEKEAFLPKQTFARTSKTKKIQNQENRVPKNPTLTISGIPENKHSFLSVYVSKITFQIPTQNFLKSIRVKQQHKIQKPFFAESNKISGFRKITFLSQQLNDEKLLRGPPQLNILSSPNISISI